MNRLPTALLHELTMLHIEPTYQLPHEIAALIVDDMEWLCLCTNWCKEVIPLLEENLDKLTRRCWINLSYNPFAASLLRTHESFLATMGIEVNWEAMERSTYNKYQAHPEGERDARHPRILEFLGQGVIRMEEIPKHVLLCNPFIFEIDRVATEARYEAFLQTLSAF